jgi:hypothetical protein
MAFDTCEIAPSHPLEAKFSSKESFNSSRRSQWGRGAFFID